MLTNITRIHHRAKTVEEVMENIKKVCAGLRCRVCAKRLYVRYQGNGKLIDGKNIWYFPINHGKLFH